MKLNQLMNDIKNNPKKKKIAIVSTCGVVFVLAFLIINSYHPNNGFHTNLLGKTSYYVDGEKQYGLQDLGYDKYYLNSKGNLLSSGWNEIDGEKIYVNKDGSLGRGLKEFQDGKEVEYDPELTDEENDISKRDLYFFLDGKPQVGWVEIGETKYYFNEDGKGITNGWNIIGGKAYYFDGRQGLLANFEYHDNDKTYQFGEDGALIIGDNEKPVVEDQEGTNILSIVQN